MRSLTLALSLAASLPPALSAQADYYARAGVTWSRALVSDRIINEISVGQGLAPTLVAGVGLPIAPRYRAALEATLTTAGLSATTVGEPDADLGSLRTGSVTLGLDGPIAGRLRWRAGAGLITYWPSDDAGIFARGGTTRFLAGAGADYRHPVSGRWDLLASARWDFHRFKTEELAARGFGSAQGIQRVGVTIGIGRGMR